MSNSTISIASSSAQTLSSSHNSICIENGTLQVSTPYDYRIAIRLDAVDAVECCPGMDMQLLVNDKWIAVPCDSGTREAVFQKLTLSFSRKSSR